MLKHVFVFAMLYAMATGYLLAQDEEDYSIYDNFESADGEEVKTYASPTILGMSPNKFVSIGWDVQLPYTMELSEVGSYPVDADPRVAETADIRYTGGFRLTSNIPVISKNNFVWQAGLNFMDVRYRVRNHTVNLLPSPGPGPSGWTSNLPNTLGRRGLRNLNLLNTFFIPINAKSFFLLQGQIDMSGDFGFRFQPLRSLKYSAAVLYGQTPHDRMQWAVGASRTYRVGNLNYVPVVMFNYTSKNGKWGTEILLPARAHGRYSFNKNNILLFGVELEGQSYRIGNLSQNGDSFEIRRGEIRPRLDFQKKLFGNFWGGFQAGYRINYSFNGDNLEDGREFFRGLFGDQPYAQINDIGNAVYFNFTISFVSN